eukprot:snap_masked-scaffold_41-processed-gene-1.20-mRNA-1 protein AED:1.00 eAED:1.00 QI:0/0/0/0/1/1/2/0/1060
MKLKSKNRHFAPQLGINADELPNTCFSKINKVVKQNFLYLLFAFFCCIFMGILFLYLHSFISIINDATSDTNENVFFSEVDGNHPVQETTINAEVLGETLATTTYIQDKPLTKQPVFRHEQPHSKFPSVSATSVHHATTFSTSKRFLALDAFLFDGDKHRPNFSSKTDDLLVLLLGVGDFLNADKTPKQEVPFLPELSFSINLNGQVFEAEGLIHTNGTFFQNKFKNGNQKFKGEKSVWITCVVPKQIQNDYVSNYKAEVGTLSLSAKFVDFSVSNVKIYDYVAPERSESELTLCTSAIYGMTGIKWISEYTSYYKNFGFEKLEFYFYDSRFLNDEEMNIKKVLEGFEDENFKVIFHNWSEIPSFGVKGVKIDNFEHGQRLARNDCYFRNRGISNYVLFVDIDEILSLNQYSLFSEYSVYKNVLEKKSIYNYKVGEKLVPGKELVSWIKILQESNPQAIGFEFTSVTVPPFLPLSYAKAASINPLVQERVLKTNFDLYLSNFSISERQCHSPYNCGTYHRGRQKYIVKTGKGAINPNNPIFYHAISENYDEIADHLSLQVPSSIAYLRHMAGHFKHSRFGGLKPFKQRHLPIYNPLLVAVSDELKNKKDLRDRFKKSKETEKFLELNDADSLYRFKYSKDKLENKKVHKRAETGERSKGLITFERFPGRLNNQLLTYDWTFRLSKAFNRTLFIHKPEKSEFWIGLPNSVEEERLNSAVWNITPLRQSFDFQMSYEIDGDLPEIHPKCTWKYGVSPKIVVEFMKQVNELEECKDRVHFLTGGGLIHPKKSDTRSVGVGPLFFWSKLQPNDYLQNKATQFLKTLTAKTIGIHSRSHNSYKEVTEKSLRRCAKIAAKPMAAAQDHVDSLFKCCKNFNSMFQGITRSSNLIQTVFENRKLDFMCHIEQEYLDHWNVPVHDEDTTLVVASDHESEPVDKLLYSKFGGVSISINEEELSGLRPPGWQSAANITYGEQYNKFLSWRRRIETVLLDMLLMSLTSMFHGGPSSTVSQVICYWRLSNAYISGTVEQSNFCDLLLLSTGSYDCKTVGCNSMDLNFPVFYDI